MFAAPSMDKITIFTSLLVHTFVIIISLVRLGKTVCDDTNIGFHLSANILS